MGMKTSDEKRRRLPVFAYSIKRKAQRNTDIVN